MTGTLIEELRKRDKKGLFESNDTIVSYSTGYPPIDFLNGFIYRYRDKETNEIIEKPILGIVGGTFTTFIGFSGSGKTTAAIQFGWNIVRPFSNGLLIHIDVEKTAIKARMLQLTGADPDDPRLILNKYNTSVESVLETISDIANAKEAAGEDAMYVIPKEFWKDPDKPVKMYVPTVIIIDSLASFNSDGRNEDEMEGQMSGGREVAIISQFYTKCLNKMAKYNISVFAINHIKSKLEVNMYQKTAPQVMTMKSGESMPRGQAPVYYAQNIFRLTAKYGMKYTMEDDGFDGVCSIFQVAKSKSSFAGRELPIAFNESIGFDPIHTMYEFACDCKLVQGRNPYLYLPGMEDMKFNRKKFRETFIKNKEFRDRFMDTLTPYMKAMITKSIDTDVNESGTDDPETDHYVAIDTLMNQ